MCVRHVEEMRKEDRVGQPLLSLINKVTDGRDSKTHLAPKKF